MSRFNDKMNDIVFTAIFVITLLISIGALVLTIVAIVEALKYGI